MILLDTNILVAYLNGHAGIARRMLDHLPEIAIPALVAAELYYGACASIRAEENLTKLDRLWQVMPPRRMAWATMTETAQWLAKPVYGARERMNSLSVCAVGRALFK